MQQFDIRRLKDAGPALIVVLQHDVLANAATVVVAPLLSTKKYKVSPRLHPVIEVEGEFYMIGTELLFAIERKRIGDKVDTAIGSIDDIKNALDLVFIGF